MSRVFAIVEDNERDFSLIELEKGSFTPEDAENHLIQTYFSEGGGKAMVVEWNPTLEVEFKSCPTWKVSLIKKRNSRC